MKKIRHIKLAEVHLTHRDIRTVTRVLESGVLVQGPQVEKLEANFAEFCGTKFAIAVNSGTAALHCGLYALGVHSGDEVITTPFTFVATANSVLMQNARVIFSDIREDDFTIDTVSLQDKITKKTKAVIAVDLFGKMCDYQKLRKICGDASVSIIEDACQAVGAKRGEDRAGTAGSIAAFSLYATKNITSGEGGIITTNDKNVDLKCRMFRHHGQLRGKKYAYADLGYNYRMTDVLAAIGTSQLAKINKYTQARIQNAGELTTGLMSVDGIILPTIGDKNIHVFNQYTIRVTPEFGASRDQVAKELRNRGIETGIYYPQPLHLYQHLSRLGYQKGDFPVSEKISQEVLSLPVHPSLRKGDISYIIEAIIDIKRSFKK